MPIFTINNQKKVNQLSLKPDGFGSEFELRDFFADNLEALLGVRFLEKEYQITEGRIDTLGIDENGSPVIIEYKWKQNEEVLAQGLFYLNWLLKNKKHFELLVESKLGSKTKVSWDQPRVILIAQGFSRYVKSAVQNVNSVELKSYALYEGNIVYIENEYTPKKSKPGDITTDPAPEKYDLNYHLNTTNPEMQKVVQKLREQILELPSIEEKDGQKAGVTYRTTKSFARFEFKKTWIQLLIRDVHYPEDEKKIIKDVTTNNWGYKGMIKLTPQSDIDYVFSLIRASYNSTL